MCRLQQHLRKMNGSDLKARLKRSGKTMTEIGALMGMSPQALNNVFKTKDVKSGILESLAERLGITIAELYEVPTNEKAITLTGHGNNTSVPAEFSVLLAAKDAQINRLLGIIEILSDGKNKQ